MTILSAIFLLFLVMDPLGNIPLFLVALRDVNPRRRRVVVARELCIALVIMLGFLAGGREVMRLLQISQDSLSIAGGLILFLIAVRMIFPPEEGIFGPTLEGEPFIVPLAVPLVAGPSSLVTIMLLVSREPDRWPGWLLAILCAWLASAVILLSSGWLTRLIKARGLIALERLMGLILTAVAVEMFLNGVREAFAVVPPAGA
ncbi:MAG: hypothetical protein GXY55_16015 [Phycisphaerae bacterium]|nr:hypothetical protein [Phycisphaerae bacterium]